MKHQILTEDEALKDRATPTICRICKENCGILVSSSEKRSIRIQGNPEHPISKGFICFRGRNFSEIRRSLQRLNTPLLRKGDDWRPITYEQAIDVLARELTRCKQQHGPESIAVLKGESLKHQEAREYLKHLTHAMGSPNYLSVGSICHQALAMAHGLTYGGIPKPDFQRIRTAVLWGSNPAVSSVRMFARMQKAVKNGMNLVVVDPCETQTTRLAAMHLRITPGADGFLALAFIKAGVENHGMAPEMSSQNGWPLLKELIDGLSYAELLEKTGIAEEEFGRASGLIFENLPGWNLAGCGLELHPAGVQTIRAVACLQSLLDPDNLPRRTALAMKKMPRQEDYPVMANPVGHREAPLFVRQRGEGQAMFLSNTVLHDDPYPVRALLVAGANPFLTFPNPGIQEEAFRKLDFLAVFDLFMTATASRANLVLPAADYLDNLELHDYGQGGKPYLGLVRPVAEQGPGWPMWKWIFTLADRLGLKSYFPWDDNKTALRYRLSGTDMDLDALMQSPAAVMPYETGAAGGRESPQAGSGIVHYYSDAAADTADAGLTTPDTLALPYTTDQTYPFWLSTGDRVAPYQHSQFRVSEQHRKLVPHPVVEIHPETAADAGIRDEDDVLVATRYGQVTVQAAVSDQVRKDCIRMLHGWDEANANRLTGTEYFDPLSGFPWCRALPAKIMKKES